MPSVQKWLTTVPPVGTVAWVWYMTTEILAVRAADGWQMVDSHQLLPGVTHWRPR